MTPTVDQIFEIDALDLRNIAARLVYKEGFEALRAVEAVGSYKQFLKMVLLNRQNITVPNEDADKAWHHHILNTQAYAADCQRIFGAFLHHDPDFYDTPAFAKACQETQAVAAKMFGEKMVFINMSALPNTSSIPGGGPTSGNPVKEMLNGESEAKSPAWCGGMLKPESEAKSPAWCGGMLKPESEAKSPAWCGGMLKPESEAKSPAWCGGMLKPESEAKSPAWCGGMLKPESEAKSPAWCGGMLKPESEAKSPAWCGGMLKPESEEKQAA